MGGSDNAVFIHSDQKCFSFVQHWMALNVSKSNLIVATSSTWPVTSSLLSLHHWPVVQGAHGCPHVWRSRSKQIEKHSRQMLYNSVVVCHVVCTFQRMHNRFPAAEFVSMNMLSHPLQRGLSRSTPCSRLFHRFKASPEHEVPTDIGIVQPAGMLHF